MDFTLRDTFFLSFPAILLSQIMDFVQRIHPIKHQRPSRAKRRNFPIVFFPFLPPKLPIPQHTKTYITSCLKRGKYCSTHSPSSYIYVTYTRYLYPYLPLHVSHISNANVHPSICIRHMSRKSNLPTRFTNPIIFFLLDTPLWIIMNQINILRERARDSISFYLASSFKKILKLFSKTPFPSSSPTFNFPSS